MPYDAFQALKWLSGGTLWCISCKSQDLVWISRGSDMTHPIHLQVFSRYKKLYTAKVIQLRITTVPLTWKLTSFEKRKRNWKSLSTFPPSFFGCFPTTIFFSAEGCATIFCRRVVQSSSESTSGLDFFFFSRLR